MTALQEMLMQTDGKRILLGPAWPAEWNVSFKLHAPYQTIVSGRVEGGKVVIDTVTPESRRADIEVFPLKTGVIPVPVSQGRPARASSTYHSAGYDATKAVDGDDATRWGSAEGARTGWLEVDLGKPAAISRVVLMERAYPSVTEFDVEAQQPDDSWKTVVTGTTIGHKKEQAFPTVTARRFRLNVKQATGNLNIEEFQLYAK